MTLKNPVLTASGTFGFGEEYGKFYDISALGGIVVKAITLEPRQGNPAPRVAETPAGLLNSIGLQNPGIDAFIEHYLPKLAELDTNVIVNIAGDTTDDYGLLASVLNDAGGIDALEINISCPNVKKGGMAFGADPQSALIVVETVKANTNLPVIVKLSPNTSDITMIAKAVEQAGADAISLINTLQGMAIDASTMKPVLGNVFGGLSGPAVKPVALRMVWQVYDTVSVPIIGIGGITEAIDAVEFMLAGASAVEVGTANFVHPCAPLDIVKGIEEYLEGKSIDCASHIVGKAHICRLFKE
jgi:dihydroorotate dehydrogenase (NAD+) catalytic subunit